MASRTIQECDLYKTEYDPDQTVTIVFKAKGKRKGRQYDLSPEAAEALERALVSNTPHRVVGSGPDYMDQPKVTVGDLDVSDDDTFIAAKLAEREDLGIQDEPSSEEEPIVSDNECTHPNRTPARIRTVNGKKGFWHKCRDCNKPIKKLSAQDQREYHSTKPPTGTQVRTHESEDRKR